MLRYMDIINSLRTAYDGGAQERNQREKADWKLSERSAFLELIKEEGKSRLLEIGAGTGQDALFFKEGGLSVSATD